MYKLYDNYSYNLSLSVIERTCNKNVVILPVVYNHRYIIHMYLCITVHVIHVYINLINVDNSDLFIYNL